MSEPNKFSLEGVVKQVMEAQTFGSGFEKREFIVTIGAESKYPQEIKLECVQSKVSLLDDVRVGDEVTALFDLRGSEYNGRYFTNLQCWKIENRSVRSGSESGPATSSPPSGDSEEPAGEPAGEYESDIPF